VKNTRSQGSTEYLVILGAVLLVSMVTVTLLGGFPSSGSTTKEQQSKAYWSGTTPFAITTAKISNSTGSFTVSNRLTEKVYLTSVEVQDASGNIQTIMTPNRVFNAGEDIVLTQLSGSNITNSTLNPCYSAATPKTGSTFEFKVVSFSYTQGSIAGIRQQGAQPLIGKCSADLSVGDRYQGGKIAYLLQPGNAGFVAGEQHGLIAATSDQSTTATWGCYGTVITGADGTAIGTGHQNTHDMITASCTNAAQLCHGVSIGGYTDWYIPSYAELNTLYASRDIVGGYASVAWYISSSEFGVSPAGFHGKYFLNGLESELTKAGGMYLRCVRAF